MANIFLHIGTHKTGTTSLQKLFHDNRILLKRIGYLYPATGCFLCGHHLLAWDILSQAPLSFQTGEWLEASWSSSQDSSFYLKSTGKRIRKTNLWQDLEQEIQDFKGDNIILSSEDFCIYNSAQVTLLKEKLSNHNVKIIVNLREPRSFALSLYKEAVKKGYSKSVKVFIETHKNQFNHASILMPWVKIFGGSNVTSLPYDKNCQSNFILKNFTEIVKFDKNSSGQLNLRATEEHHNVSFSLQTANILRHFNYLFVDILKFDLRCCKKIYINFISRKEISRIINLVLVFPLLNRNNIK
jgi:hypothetical protein